MREENGWYVLHDPSENTFWSITQPGNPAHPSAVKRTLVQGAAGVHLKLAVLCGASKDVCDRMVQTFQELDAKIATQARQQAQH